MSLSKDAGYSNVVNSNLEQYETLSGFEVQHHVLVAVGGNS
jgi:hypothetical protein